MSAYVVDIFELSDGHTLAARVLNGAKIELRKFNRDGESVAAMELSGAETEWILTSKPTLPRHAWGIGEALTIAPPDVNRTAEALNSAAANLS
ncbi:hypothetical protein A5707_11340 [Mycobacterium kyorinense]|uniref:Uncharacterized protein n=1 Tax=Mycobacterium kyorinense TaxID=487514 RepID=A0A1A2ZS98_9MYCO|nr:hypothetical protein [Mycobacterium kyorinense]OBI53459.1 hypothetical protein A5707_11340 [Mycobacterium kyorinense]